MTFLDISVPISENLPVWPGDPPIAIRKVLDVAKGDPATVSHLAFGSHTGTHVDSFSHFLPGGKTLSEMSLAPYLGLVLVVEIPEQDVVTEEHLQLIDWQAFNTHPRFDGIKRVLLKTKNSNTRWFEEPFQENFCHLHPTAADALVAQGVQLIGIDYLSVEGYHSESLYGKDFGIPDHFSYAPVHSRLMKGGLSILEGLYLADVQPGWYELICLPLPIAGGDGAPARVVLKTLG